MSTVLKSVTVTGEMGRIFSVEKLDTNGRQVYAWRNNRNEGFTSNDLGYIIDFLKETRGVKLTLTEEKELFEAVE